jgi:hypothetical protein
LVETGIASFDAQANSAKSAAARRRGVRLDGDTVALPRF